jgi:cyclopropane fatty-acyl-phospholipid synthase-like methyltransferase
VATVAASPIAKRGTAATVRLCYDLLDIAPLCGVTDFTDGKYVDERNDRSAYLAAQARQAEYLLDQALCERGTRLLDIGCGYGRILEYAERRRARALGITVSARQVARCRARGLAVHELDYRNILGRVGWALPTDDCIKPPMAGGAHPAWEHSFDAIIANGSLEHFVQAQEAAARRADAIYEEMFAICRRLLVAGGRLVTTAIHFRDVAQFNPTEILRGSAAHSRGSPAFQYAMLVETFGGWYPEPGQLERCATPCFELIEEDDGTHDYYLTSEYWLRQLKWSLVTKPQVWLAVLAKWRQHPRGVWRMLRSHLWDHAWYWQFRPPAPMRLFRQTWLAT